MLRLAFWSLLFLNAVLFAFAQGWLGAAHGNEHEPARLKRQFNTAKLALLTREQAEAAAKAPPPPDGPSSDAPPQSAANGKAGAAAGTPAAAADAAGTHAVTPAVAAGTRVAAPAGGVASTAAATPATTPAKPAAEFACTEVGPLDASDARRFDAHLAALDLGERQSRQTVQAQDVTSWLVNIPPQGSKEAADRKAAELRNLGITNFFIMNGDSPLKFALSLGVFKTETGAQTLLAQLNKQGVHTARITPRGPQTTHYVYRVRDLDAATRKRLTGYAERYDGATVKSCG